MNICYVTDSHLNNTESNTIKYTDSRKAKFGLQNHIVSHALLMQLPYSMYLLWGDITIKDMVLSSLHTLRGILSEVQRSALN